MGIVEGSTDGTSASTIKINYSTKMSIKFSTIFSILRVYLEVRIFL